ncbi:hypothetical protein V8E53_015629 [Lactarius tabidus]
MARIRCARQRSSTRQLSPKYQSSQNSAAPLRGFDHLQSHYTTAYGFIPRRTAPSLCAKVLLPPLHFWSSFLQRNSSSISSCDGRSAQIFGCGCGRYAIRHCTRSPKRCKSESSMNLLILFHCVSRGLEDSGPLEAQKVQNGTAGVHVLYACTVLCTLTVPQTTRRQIQNFTQVSTSLARLTVTFELPEDEKTLFDSISKIRISTPCVSSRRWWGRTATSLDRGASTPLKASPADPVFPSKPCHSCSAMRAQSLGSTQAQHMTDKLSHSAESRCCVLGLVFDKKYGS